MTKKNFLHKSFDLDHFFKEKVDFVNNLPSPLNKEEVLFTAYGRNALNLGMLEIAKHTKKREILVPSYTCGDELSAIKSAGFSIKPYSINKELLADFENIEKLVGQDTTGILFTHYFGFPFKGLDYLMKLRNKHNLYLIEDCAHALGSKLGDKFCGTFGDIAIFSLRKFFPIPHGGALVINNEDIELPNTESMSPEALTKDIAIFLGFRSGLLKPGEFLGDQLNTEDKHGPRLVEFGGYKLGLSKFVEFVLSKSSLDINVRRENFKHYLDFFTKNDSVKPLITNLSDGVNPLFFPLIVDDSEQAYKKLTIYNEIFAQPFWSDLHNLIDWNEYPETTWLKKSIIVLPIDNQIDSNLLERLKDLK